METVAPPVRRNRRELHMGDVKIEQKAAIASIDDHKPDVILAERDTSLDYLSELAFNEEPVTIRLEPTAEKHASGGFHAG
jgi:hypothetical protein